MKNVLTLIVLLIITSIIVTGCSTTSNQIAETPSENQTVNIYTDRHYDSDDALYALFTEDTGITVNVVKGKSDELIERLKNEGTDTEADLIILADVARLQRSKELGLLQVIDSQIIEKNIPERFREADGFWTALTKRARVIVYSKERVNPSDLSTYQDLTDSKWFGRVLSRSSENVYNQSLVSSFVQIYGEEATEAWITGLVNNFARAPKGNDRDQAKSIVAGEGDVAIMNTYYLGLMLNSSDPEEVKVAESVGIFFPNQSDDGTHINISGAAITAQAKNKENAVQLVEFLTSDKAQSAYSEANYEYPVNPNVEPSALLKSWGSFKEQQINLSDIGNNIENILKIMIQNGWM